MSQKNNTPRNEWYVNKAMQNIQEDNNQEVIVEKENENNNRSTTSSSNQRNDNNRENNGWNGFSCFQENVLVNKQVEEVYNKWKDLIILDSGSSITSFMNPDMVTQIEAIRRPMIMKTNAGNKKLSLIGNVKEFGKVWYDPTSVVNIFGLADMIKNGFRVTYDSDKEDIFMIYDKKNKKLVVKFTRTQEGLYAFKPPRKYFEMVAKEKRLTVPDDYYESMVTTVEDNKKKYIKRQYEDATVAKKLYHILGAPTIKNFKNILKQNLIKNCPIMSEHIDLAEKILVWMWLYRRASQQDLGHQELLKILLKFLERLKKETTI